MVEYIMKKGNLQDISCKMRDAGFYVSFWDCPAKGGMGGHPTAAVWTCSVPYPDKYCEISHNLILTHPPVITHST
jgi:hypothetical protein